MSVNTHDNTHDRDEVLHHLDEQLLKDPQVLDWYNTFDYSDYVKNDLNNKSYGRSGSFRTS